MSTFTHRHSRIRQIGWGDDADGPATLHPWLARSVTHRTERRPARRDLPA